MIVSYTFNTPKIKENGNYQYHSNVILDFSGDNAITSNEFNPPSDNFMIKWVSWGEKNSTVVFEDGSRFKYENGHVTMIDDGSSESGN